MLINPTLTDIKNLIANVYNKGTPTCKEWTIITLLQALANGEFDWLQKPFITVMTRKDLNLTSDNIIKHLEAEASEAHANEALGSQEAAMAAKLKKTPHDKPKAKCMNCTLKTHSFDACWGKGSGAEGKAPDWWKELKAKKNGGGGKKKREMANAAIEKEDSSGSESCTTFIATLDTEPTPTINAPRIAPRNPKANTAKLQSLNRTADSDISCVAHNLNDGKERCSIEWNRETTHDVIVTPAEVSPIPRTEWINVTILNDPFYVDSGATSHCSPHCSDFLEITPSLPTISMV
jgi:hypothetical protein